MTTAQPQLPFVFLLALGCTLLIVAIWVGYPVAMALVAATTRGRRLQAIPQRCSVSVIIATRDDPRMVEQRVVDVLRGEWPAELIEVVIGLDPTGSVRPVDLAFADPRVRTVVGELPGGKGGALNAAVAASRGDVLVFTDTAQRFDRSTIRHLCDALGDVRFGAVSGALQIGRSAESRSLAERYWEFEKWLRHNEAHVHSAVGVTGAVYAMRRDCWRPLPSGVILDDVYGPMDIVLRGWRVGFVPEAVAVDERRFAPPGEFKRKARTLTGVIQLCAWLPSVLIPWRNPVWLQFVFHKLLRLVTPYLLLVAAVAAMLALAEWAGATSPLAALAVAGGLGLALTALLLTSRRLRDSVSMAMAMQAAVVRATVNGLRGRWDVWSR